MLEEDKNLLKRVCSENHKFIDFIFNTKESHRLSKSNETSKEALEQGNKLFKQKKHDDRVHAWILKYYCKSVAFALPDSDQLVSAYMNRSAFLIHICKFQESLTDIERALGLCKDNELQRGKLLCRKLECLRKMNSDDYECVLKEVEVWIETIKSEKNLLHIESLMDKVKKLPSDQGMKLREEQDKSSDVHIDKIKATPDSFAIKFDSVYGRHLVATQDFDPGQIVFMEKAFAMMMNLDKKYTHCNYCLQITWCGIPCDYCTWASFCSESCKTQAWEKFHDIECSVIPDGLELYKLAEDLQQFYHHHIRMMIIGIKSAGSVRNLRADLESRYKLGDTTANVFSHDGHVIKHTLADAIVFTSYKTGLSILKDPRGPQYIPQLLFWIFLARESPFFKKFKNAVEMTSDDDTLFIGSIMLKLHDIRPQMLPSYNAYDEYLMRPKPSGTHHLIGNVGNANLSPLNTLINHSCCPNIARCFTKYGEGIIYALQPIEKGSQIFVTYTGSFYEVAKSQREPLITRRGMVCDCSACINDWPALLSPNFPPQMNDKYLLAMQRDAEKLSFDTPQQLIDYVHGCGENKYSQGGVEEISETLTAAMKQLEQPSMLLCYLIQALQKKFNEIYEPKKEELFSCKRQSTS